MTLALNQPQPLVQLLGLRPTLRPRISGCYEGAGLARRAPILWAVLVPNTGTDKCSSMAPVWHSMSVGLSQLLCSPWKGFSPWCWGQMALPLTLWVQPGPCGPMDGTQGVVATRGPVLAPCPMCGMDTLVMRLLWEVNGSDE